jgi:HTH-type transcriptional regulator, competence development regulator
VAQSVFGLLLRRLREERKLSVRALSQLSKIDLAYVSRLESGEKTAPSDEVVRQLIRVLKPAERLGQILSFLAGAPETDRALVELTWEDPTIDADLFRSAAGMVFRGKPDWKTAIKRIRKLREELERG